MKLCPSSLSMEEFCLDIQKWKNLKQVKIQISKTNKNTLKKSGFKGNMKYKEVACFTGFS